ncbi:potassium channel family protein [Streptomyces boninensis]|uniref:potassium channel family protein n=1 Tax=Streptomyces boninensis TaxID=2039455 RepID=UPI003B21D52A
MTVRPDQIPPARPPLPSGHLVVCGDDALAEAVADELRSAYRTQPHLLQEPPDDRAFAGAGLRRAAALALVYDDDKTNVHAALRARRLNPELRLVIRLYNRKLGEYLQELLDPPPGSEGPGAEAYTTVLSDADTATPALVAAAVTGATKVISAAGVLLRAAERAPVAVGPHREPPLCTLALLPVPGREAEGPRLLPDEQEAAEAADVGRRTVVLEAVAPAEGEPVARSWRLGRLGLPLRSLMSRRLAWTVAALVGAVAALTVISSVVVGDSPRHSAYLSILDLFAINEPAIGDPTSRQALQLLSGLVGLLLLPVLVAAALEALGTFRTATTLRRPPRGIAGHVVLLGLGKIGTRVLTGLHDLGIPVVCVEADPAARGVAVARRLHVPTVIGDVTDDEVMAATRARHAQALLAVTSDDTTNLEAVLGARAQNPSLRAVLRIRDDAFATAVYRTLRDRHPQGLTRSRSVSALAASSFAGAMMGRQIIGAIGVDRRVLLLASVEVAGNPAFEDRTVAEAFRPGAWRVVALNLASGEKDLVWAPHPGYVLQAGDGVVLAATRQGLGDLLGEREPHR